MIVSLSAWIGLNALVLAMLVLDLTLFGGKDRPPSTAKLVGATLAWIGVAMAIGLWIWGRAGADKGLEFFTGYVIEYALSLDNIFLFVLIFSNFGVPTTSQRRVLFWGVLGAVMMRGAMIFAGTALLQRFEWVIYLFAIYIIYAGISMFSQKKHQDVENKLVLRLARRFLPVSSRGNSPYFTLREGGRLKITLLLLVLVVVELTDLVFALDSIPAVFGVTTDPFIVYSSNICAVMGLRSLYFLLAKAVQSLVYLQVGLAAVLIFIGAKMLARNLVPISTGGSLLVVGGILALAVVASLSKTKSLARPHAHP